METWKLVVGAIILAVLAGPVNDWLVSWAERAEFNTDWEDSKNDE